MRYERVRPPRARKVKESEVVDEVIVEDPDAELLNDIDELLDEIDAVLEDQSILVGYRQRSGQ